MYIEVGLRTDSILKRVGAYALVFVLGLLLGLLLDYVALNYATLESKTYSQVYPAKIVSASEDELNPTITIETPIEYFFDDADVKSFFIHFDGKQRKLYSDSWFSVYITDEANSVYYYIGELAIKDGDQWVRIHSMGKLKSLKLEATRIAERAAKSERDLAERDGRETAIDGELTITMEFNVEKPYKTHWVFIGMMAVLAVIAYSLRPKSSLYRVSYGQEKWFLVALVVVLVLGASAVAYARYSPSKASAVNEMQYIELAEAFAHGQTYVLTEPSPELQAMENPYDQEARVAQGIVRSWDHAYYKGHYYVYFGVLPCLVFFLPYYLLTGGGALPVAIAVGITMILYVLGLIKLLLSISKRWFPTFSRALFLVALLTLAEGSWLHYAAMFPRHYALPILMGMMLLVFGLALWIDATATPKIDKVRAVAGSVLIALIIACRPQLILGGLFVFILLFFHARKHGGKEALAIIALCALPVLAVLAAQGCYNYIRFESPFDFGANYNITTNDMRFRGWEWDRLPLALVAYFLQPPNLGASAPFLRATDLDVSYWGTMITERMTGGIFWLTPTLAVVFLLLFKQFRKDVRKEHIVWIIVAVVVALFIAMLDAEGAGILPRYFMDFGIFLSIAAVLVILSIWGPAKQPLAEADDLAQAESILESSREPRFTTAGLVLMLLLVGMLIPVILTVAGRV